MKRAVKILLAFFCWILGYQLAFYTNSLFDTDYEWVYPVVSGLGSVLMMGAGLYGILKLVRPFICSHHEIERQEPIPLRIKA